ncbi:MAG: symporter [Nocardioides sp.]|nr:symporter [Nocardioides sp.]
MPTLSVAPALVDLGVGLVATARDIDDFSLDVVGGFNLAVKLMIGLLLLGIALDVRVEDLRAALRHPRVFVAVTAAQFVLVPLLTLGLVAALDLPPSVALGMLLVVSGPAGSMSNLLTHRARGDVALSVSLTTVSSSMAALVTPLALAFWAGLSPQASQVLDAVDLSPVEVLGEVLLLIVTPFALGILLARTRPTLAARIRPAVEPTVLVMLLLIVVGGLASNLRVGAPYLLDVGPAVVAQNALSLLVGAGVAVLCRVPARARRAITLETGVRNTALALVLALAFFPEYGGVALVCGLWGVWDVATGFALAAWWRRRPAEAAQAT